MVVLEAGIIKSSLAIIRSEYYPSEVNVDPLVKTSLLDALKTYADKAFNDQIQEVRFKKYLIITKDLNSADNTSLILYVIAEKTTDINELKKRLVNIEKKIDFEVFTDDYPILTKELIKVKKIIDKELKDLYLKPSDRLKSILG